MARLFDDASSEYLQHSAGVLSLSGGFSMGAWFNSDDEAVAGAICSHGKLTNIDYIKLVLTSGPSGIVRFNSIGDGSASYCDTSTSYSQDTWHHALGVYIGETSKAVYLDGGGKGTNTSTDQGSFSPPHSYTFIGSRAEVSTGQYFSGHLAEVAMWNTALTDDDAVMLAAGISPLLVKPQYLAAYWPVIGRTSPEIDVVGGYNMTLNGTPTAAPHPDIITPSGPLVEYPSFLTPTSLLTLHPLQAVPTTSNAAVLGLRNRRPNLGFDDTTAQSAVFDFTMPRSYGGSDITVVLHSAAATATSGNAKVGVSLERIGDQQQDVDSDGFAGVNNKVFVVPDVSGYIKQTRIRFTAGADMDSIAAGEKFRLKVTRLADETNDDLSGDWQLFMVDLRSS